MEQSKNQTDRCDSEVSLKPLLGGICPDCDGEGELYVGSSVPDDEGFTPCILCDGTGQLPDIDTLRKQKQKWYELEGDAQADKYHINLLKDRIKELEGQISP